MQLKQSGYFHAGICVYIIMVNKQIWPDEIQPIENLTFVPVESTYVKVFIARLVLVYIIFMACALIIPLLADLGIGWEVIAVECALAAAFVINLALVRKIYDIRGYALRDKDISYRRGVFFYLGHDNSVQQDSASERTDESLKPYIRSLLYRYN